MVTFIVENILNAIYPKSEEDLANCVDLDQTAPIRSSLIRVYTVCSGSLVPIIGTVMVSFQQN